MPGIFETFGKYRLTERLAFGGMAEVFLATIHGAAGFVKPVVIKRLHPRLSEDSDFVQMLIDEARITAQLIHGNVCQVLDLGAVDSSYYIAMEFVSGEDLRTLQDACGRRRIELPAEAAIYIVSEVLAGLDYAHRKEGQDGRPLGIVHRDISPQNVLLSYEGEVKIIDFGIAKARQRLVQTQAGVIKGKFRYMSPEQASGDPIDHRTDIFAAGVVLYELLRGSPHSLELSDTEVLRRMRRAEFDPLTRIRPSVPAELDALVRKALARRARDRYGSAAEFRQVLLQFLVARGVSYGRTELAALMRSYFDEERRRKRSGSVVSAASELASTGGTGPPRREPTDVLGDADLVEYSSEPGARSEKWVAFAATTESTPHALAQRERSGSASIRERSDSAVELSAADAFEVESIGEEPPAQLPDTEQTRAFDPERRPASSVAARRAPSQRRRGPEPPRYEEEDASVPTAAMSRPAFSEPEDQTRERSAPLPPTNELPHLPTARRDPPGDLHRQPTGAPDRARRPVDDRRTLPERDEDRRTLPERDDRPSGGTGFFSQRAETRIGEAAPPSPIPRQRATALRTAIGVGIVVVLGSGLALALFLLDRPLPVPPPMPGSSGSSLAQMLHGDGGARPLEARARSLSPTAKLGVVRVVSKPAGARVVLCGVPIEMRTPAVAQAEIGVPCTVELQLDGFQTYRTEITPRPGSPLLIVATLRRGGGGGGSGGPRPPRGGGTLRVTSIQVGTVYVEGKVVGRTPMLAVPLAAGEYNVKMHFPTLDVMTRTRRVTIQAGKTTSLHFDATP